MKAQRTSSIGPIPHIHNHQIRIKATEASQPFFHDVAKRLSEKMAGSSLEAFVQNIPGVAIQRIDENSTIQFWNHTSEVLYGYSSEFALGKRFDDLLINNASRPEFNKTFLTAWQDKEISPISCWLLKSAMNENLWVHGALMPYCKDGDIQELFSVQIDATAYHKAETLLIQYKDNLEAHVKRRSDELGQANERLQQEILTRTRAEKKLLKSKEALERTVNQRTKKLNKTMSRLTKEHQELIQYKNKLETLNQELLDTNKAISVLARNIEKRKETVEGKTTRTISEKIMPAVEHLIEIEKDPVKIAELDSIATHLRKISATAVANSKVLTTLSAIELKVAHMIKNGFTSKEISRQLFVSLSTVKSHRRNIRKKLGINNTCINLENYLLSKLGTNQRFS